jgi:hypothetical protein
MKIEAVPRKTAYYKKKQGENILQSLGLIYFRLSDCFWDFIVLSEGNVKLVKVISSNELIGGTIPLENHQFDREIWRFAPNKKMPEVQKIEKTS